MDDFNRVFNPTNEMGLVSRTASPAQAPMFKGAFKGAL
jgi:hypothetical protein